MLPTIVQPTLYDAHSYCRIRERPSRGRLFAQNVVGFTDTVALPFNSIRRIYCWQLMYQKGLMTGMCVHVVACL